jgi:hypothetical protein
MVAPNEERQVQRDYRIGQTGGRVKKHTPRYVRLLAALLTVVALSVVAVAASSLVSAAP